jgi:energy-coupling factor transporter ATP-binding protein EcfA2
MPVDHNPYRPLPEDDVTLAPFTRLQGAFEHFYQQLASPNAPRRALLLGRRDSGKSTLLRHFHEIFDPSYIGAYLPLRLLTLASEDSWLRTMAASASAALVQAGLQPPETQAPEDVDGAALRAWFKDTFLRDLFAALWGKRLVFLLDDAGTLLTALKQERLPYDHLSFLNGLLTEYAPLGIVLAVDSRYEASLASLAPLISLTDVYRLMNLDADASAALLRVPVDGVYHLNDEGVAAAYKATAGRPRLLQRYGFLLYKQWESVPAVTRLTADDVKVVTSSVYAQSEDDFQTLWDDLSRNERLVLTALTHLAYADPLKPPAPADVETWLIESDYPLDRTSIHSALRGLEYDEIIAHERSGIVLNGGLLQTWLLEHVRLNDSAATRTLPRASRWGWALLAAVLLLVLLAAGLALLGGQQRAAPPAVTAAPTVTLVGGG